MRHEFIGAPRLRPGEGFGVPKGLWRTAVSLALERPAPPARTRSLSGHWYETPHGRIFARASATRPPATPAIVFIHGVIVSSRYLVPCAAELADSFRVIVPDLPGYGHSAHARTAPTVADLADAAIACARAAGAEDVALVGNSFGAQVAVEAAIRHPALVRRAVLIGPTTDPAARTLLRQYVRWQRNAPDEHLSVLPVMARDVADIGLGRATAMLRAMLDHRVEERLPDVGVPTLVVRGGRDRVTTQQWAQRVTELLPKGELAVVPGYAHMPHWSGVRATAPLLRRFLER